MMVSVVFSEQIKRAYNAGAGDAMAFACKMGGKPDAEAYLERQRRMFRPQVRG